MGFQKWWIDTHPKPPPPPNVFFKKITKIKFPQRQDLPLEMKYKLETVSGFLPAFGNQANVYFMPKASNSLLASDKVKTWARGIGFTQDPQDIGDFNFRFNDSTNKTVLDINYLTRNFSISYDWKNDLSLTSPAVPPDEKQATTQAKQYLQTIQSFPADLQNGQSNVIYYKYKDNDLTEVSTAFEANFVRVNLLRENIESGNDPSGKEMKIKIMPENPRNANISFLISPLYNKNQGVLESKVIHWPISNETVATYPIKDINTAWTELQTGKGFIANLGNNSDGNIIIRKGYLAYFESQNYQSFLQPIFVFEGDREFWGYVTAITSEWQAE